MRLLKRLPNGNFELIFFSDDNSPPYAILSHTWAEGQEVTYSELVSGTGKDKAGYAKIHFCVDRAAKDGLQYSWVDTCCINKSSDSELSEAINSMFRWYQRSAKCYVYLADISSLKEDGDCERVRLDWEEAFRKSRWFKRGWTLQELIAPEIVEFYGADGTLLGDKLSLERTLHAVTGVATEALRGCPLSHFDIAERFSWATDRQTKRAEDRAYSLLGIFDVSMPSIYGEGEEKAVRRLHELVNKPRKCVSFLRPIA
jgi:hypothetical protein